MTSSQNTESGIGLHVGNGPGPFLIQNNLILGTGVTGTYLSDDITSGTGPCGGVGGLPACPPMYNTGDLTERRNTIRANPCYWAGSACWNGGNYYWRNADEVKQGKMSGKMATFGDLCIPRLLRANASCMSRSPLSSHTPPISSTTPIHRIGISPITLASRPRRLSIPLPITRQLLQHTHCPI